MSRIYFDEHDRLKPMRDCVLESPEGRVDLREFYGKCNLVLFFSHGEGCAACRAAAEEISRHADEFAQQDAQVLIILQELPQGSRSALVIRTGKPNISVVEDCGEAAKRYFLEDLDNTDENSAILYILDQYQAPYAAFVGEELPEKDLISDVLSWLSYIQIQCPE